MFDVSLLKHTLLCSVSITAVFVIVLCTAVYVEFGRLSVFAKCCRKQSLFFNRNIKALREERNFCYSRIAYWKETAAREADDAEHVKKCNRFISLYENDSSKLTELILAMSKRIQSIEQTAKETV